jgi:hypothetical protein
MVLATFSHCHCSREKTSGNVKSRVTPHTVIVPAKNDYSLLAPLPYTVRRQSLALLSKEESSREEL